VQKASFISKNGQRGAASGGKFFGEKSRLLHPEPPKRELGVQVGKNGERPSFPRGKGEKSRGPLNWGKGEEKAS